MVVMSSLPLDAITLPPAQHQQWQSHPSPLPSLAQHNNTSRLTPPPRTLSHPLLPSPALPRATLLPHHHPRPTTPTHHCTSAQHLTTPLDRPPPLSTLTHSASPCLHIPTSVCTHTDSKSACVCTLPCVRSLSPSLPLRPHCVMHALGHPPTHPYALECMHTHLLKLTLAVFLALGTSISPTLPCLTLVLALSCTPQNRPHLQQQCGDNDNVMITLLQSSRRHCDHSPTLSHPLPPSPTLSHAHNNNVPVMMTT